MSKVRVNMYKGSVSSFIVRSGLLRGKEGWFKSALVAFVDPEESQSFVNGQHGDLVNVSFSA